MKVDKTKWMTKPISSLFDLQMGKTPSRKSPELWENGNTPWVSISDMNGIKYISSTKEMLPFATIIQCNIPIIPAGIVIMSFKLTIGKTCITNVPLTTNEAIMAFYPKKEVQIDNSFLCYALSAIKWKGNRAVKGLTINKKTISQKEMSLPPLSEQQAIASELDATQTMIDGYKAQLEDLDALAQSIFLDMFGDPVSNPKGWELHSIASFGKIVTGNTPSKSVEEYYNSDYIEWIKTDNIQNNDLYPTVASEYLSEEGSLKGRIVEKNSILVCCIAGSLSSIGKCCITNCKVAFNQQINAIECNPQHNYLFSYWLIKCAQKIFMETASTGMKHILSKSVMSSIKLPVPAPSLQQLFAHRIEAIEQQKELIRFQLKDAETLMAERMQYYFS